MNINPNLPALAGIISDPSRAAILTSLLDDRFYSAGELASIAKIKPQTASFHLSKLLEENLITAVKQGRHRYFRLQNQEVARIIETLLTLTPPARVNSLKQSVEDKAIRNARTCYDHVAGYLGVQLADSLIKKGYIADTQDGFKLTEEGVTFCTSFGIDLNVMRKKRRSFCHKCLDWSERKFHIAGAVGNALLERFIDLNWIQRQPNTRALVITNIGKREFMEKFSIDMKNRETKIK